MEVDRRTVASPFLIMYYAEKQYFIKQYKKNKAAFEDVKNELLLILDENSEKGCILQYYNRTTYSIDHDNFIDANGESYIIVDKSFSDYSLSKIYVTHYAPRNDDKIHKFGNDWYLITPN